mgnify:CR=1 FL=1
MKDQINADAASGFITCQPSHTLKMVREILLSVMLIISFLYFLGVVYIFFTGSECNVSSSDMYRDKYAEIDWVIKCAQETTEVWCHIVSLSALLSFIAIYCTRWGVEADSLDPRKAGLWQFGQH